MGTQYTKEERSVLIKNTITMQKGRESRQQFESPLRITEPKLDFKIFRDGNPSGFGSMEFEREFHILVLICVEKNIMISKD